ncbi:MAG: CDP-alcohol phosphatidyltransferase family protein, partial [Deltaproteobacteria bacterium]
AARAMVAEGSGSTVCPGTEVLLAHVRTAGSTLGMPPGAAVTDGVVLPARDAPEARAATRALLSSLRKPQDGWISKLLNRRLSLATTRLLVHTSIRPNQLSVVILGLGLFGAWLAARGDYASLAWGGVLFQLQSVLDGCDGELSRLTFRGSKTGEWLDTVGDDLTNYAFFGGAAWGLYVSGLGTLPLVFGGVGVALGVITSGIEYRYLIRIGSGDLLKYPLGFGNDPEPSRTPGPIARVLGAIRPAFKRDFFVFLAMLMALAGRWTTLVMLGLFVGGAVATFSAVMASEIRRARERNKPLSGGRYLSPS